MDQIDIGESDEEFLPGLAVACAERRRTAGGPASPQKLRWTINGDFIALHPTGVARYAREVTLALDALVSESHPLSAGIEIDLVAPKLASKTLPLSAIGVRVVPEFRRPRLPQLWVQVQLPHHVPGGLLSFCNLAPILIRRQIVCIHDLHTRLMPASYGAGFRMAHRVVLPIVGRRAASITTVSNLSRRHLVEYGIAPWEKITVTYNGSEHTGLWDATQSTLAAPSDRPYVLSLGRGQPYKNAGLLVRLAPLLDRFGIDVWMAGDVDESVVLGSADRRPSNLHVLGRISDDDFKRALSGALCFLFPSRIEGFGLPAVEAMASGCPVVASTSPCLPEICGEAALYADPDDLEAWSDAVKQLLERPELRRHKVAAGRTRARDYSWRSIAETYLALIRKIEGLPNHTKLGELH